MRIHFANTTDSSPQPVFPGVNFIPCHQPCSRRSFRTGTKSPHVGRISNPTRRTDVFPIRPAGWTNGLEIRSTVVVYPQIGQERMQRTAPVGILAIGPTIAKIRTFPAIGSKRPVAKHGRIGWKSVGIGACGKECRFGKLWCLAGCMSWLGCSWN